MPTYSFKCQKCRKKFEKVLSFKEFDDRRNRSCPKCGSKDVAQLLGTFYAKTSRKS